MKSVKYRYTVKIMCLSIMGQVCRHIKHREYIRVVARLVQEHMVKLEQQLSIKNIGSSIVDIF